MTCEAEQVGGAVCAVKARRKGENVDADAENSAQCGNLSWAMVCTQNEKWRGDFKQISKTTYALDTKVDERLRRK